jgi:RNA-binding protein 26
VPSQLMAMNGPPLAGPGLPFMPFFPGPLPMLGIGGAYDPHESRLEMRPPSAIIGPGDAPPHMAPTAPRVRHENVSIPPHSDETSLMQHLGPGHPSEGAAPHASMSNSQPDVEMGSVPSPLPHTKRRPDRSSEKTLVVEKIPEDKLTHEAIGAWFKRFGTVTHVAIDTRGSKALVSFSEHSEAHAAWRSEDAVFNNRFVKLFWHRPMAGHGQTGARMLAASAPLVANITRKEISAPSEGSKEPAKPATAGPAPKPTNTPADIMAKKQQLEHQIAEQKSLMASLENSSPEEKREILARARMNLPPASLSENERKEKSPSDKELATHSVDDGSVKETSEDLKAKLAKLKVEVSAKDAFADLSLI